MIEKEIMVGENIPVLDANSDRGPEIRDVSLSLWSDGRADIIRFRILEKDGAVEPGTLYLDAAFIASMNRAMNEVFAMAGIVGEPFRNMVMASGSCEQDDSRPFGYSVSGRPAERAASIIRENAGDIRVAAEEYSLIEERRIRQTVSDPEIGLHAGMAP